MSSKIAPNDIPGKQDGAPGGNEVAKMRARIQQLEEKLASVTREKMEQAVVLEEKLASVTREKMEQAAVLQEKDEELRAKGGDIAALREQLEVQLSSAGAPENKVDAVDNAIDEDPQIARQDALLQDVVLPNVETERSDYAKGVIAGAMNVVDIFGNIETKPVNDSTYPELMYRNGFEPGSRALYSEMRGIVRGSAAAIVAKRVDTHDWETFKLVESIDFHHSIGKLEMTFPPPFQPRDIVVDGIWAKNPKPAAGSALQAQLIFVGWPTTHLEARETHLFVRAKVWEVTLLNQISPEKTEYISICKLDLGGSIPVSVSNLVVRDNNGVRISDIQSTFLCRLPLSKCVDSDGPSFAYAFLAGHISKTNKTFSDSSFNVASVINAHVALRQVNQEFAAFGHIITAILEGRLGVPFKCEVPLARITPAEAVRIGSNLHTCLLTNTEPRAAAVEWISTYRALGELKDRYPWYEPMVTTLAVSIVKKGNAGLRARVLLGLCLSTLDVATDILMVMQFMSDGEDYFAGITIACCCICIVLNIVLVIGQHHRAGLGKVLLEILFVVTFTKPAVDAYAVSSGKEMTELMSFDPLTEFVMGKGIELASEAIPGAIVQTYALLIARPSKRSMTAVISIAVSLGTTAFTSAMITYDFDNSPPRRRDQPKMYGITGDEPGQKMMCFIAIYVMAFTHVAGRIVAAAMFTAVSGALTMWALAGEMGLYFVYKLARSDFTYWVPTHGTMLTALVAVIARMVRKLIFDFTGLLQERHPYEMGGQVFFLSMLWSQAVPHVAKDIYYSRFDAELFNITLADGTIVEGSNMLDEEKASSVLSLLTTVWACALLTLIYNMDRDLLPSFFTSMTGHEYTVSLFRASDSDEAKFGAIFGNHDSHALSIRGDVKKWVLENYEGWETTKPTWFNDANIAKIPSDMIPIRNLEALLEAGGGERAKRNSFLMPRVSLRESKNELV
jgi:hypothetical protein